MSEPIHCADCGTECAVWVAAKALGGQPVRNRYACGQNVLLNKAGDRVDLRAVQQCHAHCLGKDADRTRKSSVRYDADRIAALACPADRSIMDGETFRRLCAVVAVDADATASFAQDQVEVDAICASLCGDAPTLLLKAAREQVFEARPRRACSIDECPRRDLLVRDGRELCIKSQGKVSQANNAPDDIWQLGPPQQAHLTRPSLLVLFSRARVSLDPALLDDQAFCNGPESQATCRDQTELQPNVQNERCRNRAQQGRDRKHCLNSKLWDYVDYVVRMLKRTLLGRIGFIARVELHAHGKGMLSAETCVWSTR